MKFVIEDVGRVENYDMIIKIRPSIFLDGLNCIIGIRSSVRYIEIC